MRDSRRVTLADVAARAGVSAITISRALRTPDKVSARLRDKISRVIEELGYVPDPAARALASGRTDVIGVIIPSVTNAVFSDVLLGIYTAIEDTPFDVQLGNTRYSALKEESLIKVFLRQKPAALLVTGIDQSEESRALLEAAPCPVVQIMEVTDTPVDMVVGFSHYEAARAATAHLVAEGYRRPAFVGARMDPRTQRRFNGFRDVAREAGLYSESRVITTSKASTVTLGAQLFAELVSREPDVDAVFCNNDDLAMGVMFEARRRRIAIPDQLGICGFNDLEMMAAADPSITSVRTFRYEMGQRAIDMLVDAVGSEERKPQPVVDLGFEIRKRQSTERTSR